MANYNFKIVKGDHPGDLHVHIYYNDEKPFGKLLGKFRIPSLEPLHGTKYTLNKTEISALKEWLNDKKQLKKLQDCLNSTLFNSHELAKRAINNIKEGIVIKEKGETFITIKIPVIDRL